MVSRNVAAAIFPGFAALFFILFATSGRAVSDSVSQNRGTTAEVQQFLDRKLRIWQERLNLDNWKIQVNLVKSKKLEPKTLGNIHWDTEAKTARISVLAPEEYKLAKPEMLEDMEFTIVHELVHLHLASLPRSEASRREEEHAVNELSRALLRLAR